MKKEFDVNFCFKGERKYVHGTDIYTKLTEMYPDIQKLDIAFHGITTNNMTFFSNKPTNADIKVIFKCDNGSQTIKLFGIENDLPVQCRYEYLEENIVKNSSINISEESITLQEKTHYTFIEHIVAMNKALLETLFQNINGKWYFTRLQLKEKIGMREITDLKLTLTSNFQFKLTKSAIIANGKEIGYIYFSLIPKES